MFSPDRICGVVAASAAPQAERQLRDALRAGAHTVELRLDYLRSAAERAALLRRLLPYSRRAILIATCRTLRGRGRFAGSPSDELAVLAQAVRAGCRWCDVELETAVRYQPADLRRALAPGRLLVSAHDFRRMPRDLRGLVRRLDRVGADAVKLAVAYRSLDEVRRLLALPARRRDFVVVPMGEDALAPRILALRHGSALAYAPVVQSTAPGQIPLDQLKRTYRLDRRFGASVSGPTPRTHVYGVIGDPLGHTLSPLMHNAAFAAQHANALYLPFRVHPGLGLREFLGFAKKTGIRGFSVTIPHKQAILRHLDECDPLSAQIGAVNTVAVRPDGRLYGYNTDYVGVLQAIQTHMPLPGSRVLLFGAGGAARASAFALAHAGAAVVICARRPAQARELARAVGATVVPRKMLRSEFFDAIVNCTPIGMYPAGGSPLESAELNCRVVMDLIYRPRKTELLHRAERRGIKTISGVEMFVAQGVAQYEIWNRRRAPVAVMRRAVTSALDKEEKGTRKMR